MLLFIAADLIYDYITVHSATYLGGDPVDSRGSWCRVTFV